MGPGTVVTLPDGALLAVRPVGDDDAALLVEFHDRLSDRSRYFRFFSPHPTMGPREARYFARVDGRDRMAFVAELEGEIVGVGRYDRLAGEPTKAEVAFTVDDDHQGRGIGTVMVRHLAQYAATQGISTFTAWVLLQNHKMLEVFAHLGAPLESAFDAGAVRVTFDIHHLNGDGSSA